MKACFFGLGGVVNTGNGVYSIEDQDYFDLVLIWGGGRGGLFEVRGTEY